MGERRDVIMSECGDAMAGRSYVSVRVSLLRMLERLPGMLMSGQVILVPLLLANPMEVRRTVL